MNNGYHQGYPPRGPPPPQQQRYYDRPIRQQQQQPPQSSQRPPLPAQYGGYMNEPRYDNYDNERGYNYDNSQYMQNGNFGNDYRDSVPVDDRYGQRQYQDSYQQQRGPERNYQYDERYRINGGGSRQDIDNSGYGPNPDRRKPPAPVATNARPKERERILQKQESPKTAAWDNPFGAFPTKTTKKREGSKDEKPGVAQQARDVTSADSFNSRAEQQRPSTSHDNRDRREPPRPHTSNGQRRPPRLNNQDVPPPSIPSQQRLEGRDGSHGQGQISRRPLPPQRAMTGPLDDSNHNPRFEPQPNYDEYQFGPPGRTQTFNDYGHQQRQDDFGYDQYQGRSQPQRDQYHNGGHEKQLQHDDRNWNSRSLPESPMYADAPYEDHYQQQSAAEQRKHMEQYSRQDANPSMAYRGVAAHKNAVSASDVPNFDAMPVKNERAEDQLSIIPPPQQQTPYAKETYRSTGTPKPQEITYSGQSANQEALVSPLAQFTFDIPDQNPRTPAPQMQQQQNVPQNYDPRVGTPQSRNMMPQPPHIAQDYDSAIFPTRGASRNAPPPPSSNQAYPPVSSQDHLPRQPLHNQNGPHYPGQTQDRFNEFHQQDLRNQNEYGQRLSREQQDRLSGGSGSDSNGYRSHPQRMGYDPRLQPSAASPTEQYQQGPPPPHQQQQLQPPVRPRTANSAHPSTATLDGRRVSAENFRPNMSGRNNPDSLPAHPAPFRPGLMQPPPSAPTPVNNAPPPQQVPLQGGSESPVTVQELNMLRDRFRNNPEDHELGLRFAQRLVEAARVLVPSNSGDPKQVARNRERYVLDAHKIVKKLISAGYPEAMFYMADCYGQGMLGLEPDPKEAFSLYQSAAKMGHAQAAYRVAVCCELGPEEGGGTRRDPMKAVQWYKRAATLGDAPAMYKMGMIQLKGLLGQQRSPREAVSWLKRAAERADAENPHALHELALLYESAQSTDIVLRDERYALELFIQAAELGYKYSQFRLGSAYEYGLLGCPIDPRRSIGWYSRAAAQGEHQSEFALSGWYLTGGGQTAPGEQPLLPQSDSEAYLWARKAAASGLAKAEYAMGYYTEVGIGTQPDINEAKKWYFRAAANNHPKARDRLEDLKRGGARMQKTRVSRSHVGKHNEGECTVM